jgi:1-phosphofructokinase
VIRTVTLNTGFDETLRVGPTDPGGVAPLLERSIVPSGKGINCARVLQALGAPVVAYGLIGAIEETAFHDALHLDGVRSVLVAVPHSTRTNVTIAPPSGAGPHYRAAGFALVDTAPLARLTEALEREVEAGDIVSLHGSTPDGAPVDTWREIAERVSRRGALVLADVYGAPLVRVLERVKVFASKPNAQEMTVLPGVQTSPDPSTTAVRVLIAAGVELPLVSLGASGLLYAESGEVWQASLDPDAVARVVGAGDACMAGLAAALADGTRDARSLVRAAIATAVAHVEGADPQGFAARASVLERHVRFRMIDSAR